MNHEIQHEVQGQKCEEAKKEAELKETKIEKVSTDELEKIKKEFAPKTPTITKEQFYSSSSSLQNEDEPEVVRK